jgi:DHA1 family tetracycline resistance protein-like MFS transporter
MFPFVPIYVSRHGGGPAAIALFVAGPMIATSLVQVPAGRLVDRWGRRPMLLVALAGFSVFSALLAVDHGPLWLLGLFRAGTGVFGGMHNPAMRAALADLTPPEKRAERFGQSQAAFMLGLLLGPAAGGVLAGIDGALIFVCSAVAGLLAAVVIALTVPETRGLAQAEAAARTAAGVAHHAARGWWLRRGIVIPVVGLAAMGLVMSMYDVVWPLYLTSRGQSTAVIGFSVTLFAVPFLVFSRSGGRLADRGNRRLMIGANFAVAALTAMSYPFLHALWTIFCVGFVEATAWVTTEPILYAVLTDAAPAAVRGQAMAAGGLAEFAGGAVGALALGSLYGVSVGAPFWAGAVVLVLAGALCAALVPARTAAGRLARSGEVALVTTTEVA